MERPKETGTEIEVYFNGEWRPWNVYLSSDVLSKLEENSSIRIADDDQEEIFIRKPINKNTI